MMKIAEYVKTMTAPRNFDSLEEAQMFLDKVYSMKDSREFVKCTLVKHRPQYIH